MTAIDLDFSDLRALFLNCTLKRSPEPSNTQALMDNSIAIMEAHGVRTETIRVVDHDVPHGVYEDMTEHGYDADPWVAIQEQVFAANILVMPNLDSANIGLTLLGASASGLQVGPMLLGLQKPLHVLVQQVTARGIVNMTAIAAAEAGSDA